MQHIYAVLLCSLCLLGFSRLQSQNLEAGDIAFVSYRGDPIMDFSLDAFAFVALTDIPANEVIFFTDKGWTTSNTFISQEGVIQYTAPPLIGISCGTVVTIAVSAPMAASATIGTAGIASAGFDLDDTSGDQILAFQGILAAPTFIAAINNSGATGEWQTIGIDPSTSTLPTGLIDGETAVSLVHFDNANYDDSTVSGLKSDLLSEINKEDNWDQNNSNNQLPTYLTPFLTITDCNADDANITHTGTAPISQNIGPGTTNVSLYEVQVDVSTQNVILTELTFATAGAWIPSDIVNFKLRYSLDATLDALDATLDEIEMGFTGGTESITFDGFQQSILAGTSGYLFITIDASNDGIFCRDISVEVDADADFTYSQVPTYINSSFEAAEAFILGSGVIVDAQFVKTASSVLEGNINNPPYFIDVIVEDRPCGDLMVSVSSVTGSASAGDFSAVDDTLVFPTLSEYPLTLQLDFAITNDFIPEDDETFDLVLSIVDGFGALGVNTTHTVTIIDDDNISPLNYYSNCPLEGTCNWTSAIWNTQADGLGMIVSNPDDPNANIIIQSGDSVILDEAERSIRNLSVEANASLTAIGNTTNAKFLTVFGPDVEVEGMTSEALSLNIGGRNTTISGNGNISFRRIRHTGLSDANLTIDANMDLTYSAGTALYNFVSNYDFDVTINSGKTVNVTSGNVSIDGADGINGGERTGTFTIDGTLKIDNGILYLYTDNDVAGIEYVVNGYLLVGGSILGSALETGISQPALLTVNTGGTLEVSGAGDPFSNISAAFNVVNFQINSNVIYSSDMSQNVADEFEYANFESTGGGNKSLSGDITVNGVLTPTNGNIVIGLSDLFMGPSASALPGSAASYVRTNGLGVMTYEFLGTSPRIFPVGNSTYNPITLTNNGTLDEYSARVVDRVPEGGTTGTSLTTRIVNRSWRISEGSPGGGNLEVEVGWNAAEEAPGFMRELSYISRYTNNEWQADTPKAALGNDPYSQTRTAVTVGLTFAVGSSGALPVDWLYFRAQAQTTGNLLEWATSREIGNEYFAIERSTDGIQFSEIGRVAGQGNRETETTYAFLDRNPPAGNNYYRLLQVDFDGSSAYSVVKMVRNTREEEPSVYPNPAKDEMTIDLKEGIAGSYRIRNNLGQLVREGTIENETSRLLVNTQNLLPGVYWVQVKRGNQVKTLSFQKM